MIVCDSFRGFFQRHCSAIGSRIRKLLFTLSSSQLLGMPSGYRCSLAGLQTIPEELHEAAKVEGAGPVQRFIYVTFPLLRETTLIVLATSLHFRHASSPLPISRNCCLSFIDARRRRGYQTNGTETLCWPCDAGLWVCRADRQKRSPKTPLWYSGSGPFRGPVRRASGRPMVQARRMQHRIALAKDSRKIFDGNSDSPLAPFY
jgi:hypothetical protein